MHSIEDIQVKRRSITKNLRLAVKYIEENKLDIAKQHMDVACQDWKLLFGEIEAASAVSGIGE